MSVRLSCSDWVSDGWTIEDSIDLSRRLIAIANQPDSKTYDIYLEALPSSVLRDVRQGSEVGISAVFDGSRYVARSIELAPSTPSTDR